VDGQARLIVAQKNRGTSQLFPAAHCSFVGWTWEVTMAEVFLVALYFSAFALVCYELERSDYETTRNIKE